MVKKTIKEFPFTMGADPEFNIVMQDKQINAQNFFKDIFDKDKTRKDMGYEIGKEGSIGWDGASHTAEARPAPANTAAKLTENLGAIFKETAKHAQLFELSTLSNAAPVGGHIHFLLPDNSTDSTSVKKIHKQLSSFYIPLLLGEDALNLRIRKNNGYGEITDHRTQEIRGDKYTFEFRVPSAEWLTTPRITLSTIAYLGTVYNEILNHPENMKLVKEILITSNKQAEALQSLSMSSFVFLTQALIQKIKKHIKQFEFYPQYKEEIDFILNPKKVLKEKQKVDFNILKGWNLYDVIKFNKTEFLNRKNVEKFGKKVDLDKYKGGIPVKYNDDDYVSNFVRDLEHRTLTFNMKLKNKYFVFGLRKGITKIIATNKNHKYVRGAELIKSDYEHEIIMTQVFERMNQRFYTTNSGNHRPKDEDDGRKHIIIGLPYEMRLSQDSEEFLKFIYDLEKQPKKYPEVIPERNSQVDSNSEVYRAYKTDTETTTRPIEATDATRQAQQEIDEESL